MACDLPLDNNLVLFIRQLFVSVSFSNQDTDLNGHCGAGGMLYHPALLHLRLQTMVNQNK